MMKSINLLRLFYLFIEYVTVLRTSFRPEAGRHYSRSERYFVKTYKSHETAEHEYRVLNEIKNAQPETFDVPRTYGFASSENQAFVRMEQVRGNSLECLIHDFLLFGSLRTIETFLGVGKALHELHKTNFSGSGLQDNTFCSETNLLHDLKHIAKRLSHLGIISVNEVSALISAAKSCHIDRRLLQIVNAHGEAYFTHILSLDGKVVFLDLERAQRNASHFDLANFITSLYTSLLIPKSALPKLKMLRNSFLSGYFERDIPFRSVRIIELYGVLRELDKLCTNFSLPNLKLRIKVLLIFKLKRLLWLLRVYLQDMQSNNIIKNHDAVVPRLFAFFGPDGAGKSVHAQLLERHLRQRGIKTKKVWIRSSHTLAYLLLRFLKGIFFCNSFSSKIREKNLTQAVPIKPQFRRFWGLTELISVLPVIIFRTCLPLLLGYTIVADRYVLDTIATIAYYVRDLSFIESPEARLLLHFIPENSKFVHLDSDYETITRRRSGIIETRDSVEFQRSAYRIMRRYVDATTIDTSRFNVEETRKQILQQLCIE